jgi:hypothetical protein
MNPKAINIKYKSPYQFVITFDNNEKKIFDIQPYLNYPVYKKLQNESFCSSAKIRDGIVFWNEEIDMDPDRLYLESSQLNYKNV